MRMYRKEWLASDVRLLSVLNQMLGVAIGLCLLAGVAQGQNFQYRSEVQPATKPGFYRIMLPTEVVGHLNAQFSDLRLYDEQQHEVPYLLKREQPVRYQTLFREYKLVSKESTPKVGTVLVLQNSARSRINNLSLLIKNARVHKKVRLSGSNDARNWYVIEENYLLESIDNREQTAEVKILDFPLSDYEYYQLEINDSLSAPLNILRAGYYDVQTENGKYTLISGLSFTQRDSLPLRQSFVHVTLADTARIDKLTLRITPPTWYRRQAQLCRLIEQRGKTRKRPRIFDPLSTLKLSSAGENTVHLSGFRAKDFFIIIDNEDNQPLTISRVEASQLHTSLIAQLEPGKNYHLAFSSPGLGPPKYDLRYFQDKIPGNLAVLDIRQPVRIGAENRPSGPSLFSNRNMIWLAMGLVLLLLSYLSFRMVKELGKK